MSNAEIAAALFLGEATVKTHVPGVRASSACATACRPSSLAYESGLVEPGSAAVERAT